MPELPEAETIARQLQARLAGARLGEVRWVRADIVHGARRSLRKMLPGLLINRVYRRAKRVVVEVSDASGDPHPVSLVVALGMTGQLRVCGEDLPVEKHTHLRVAIADSDQELRFRDPRRFGGVWLLPDVNGRLSSRQAGRGRRLRPVGPEPLDIKPAAFVRLLRRKRSIKSLLLDQTIIAGLGNIYCDESLFAAAIHPRRAADSLSEAEAKALLRAIKSILRRAIRFNGSTFMDYRSANGASGSFQRFHKVYNRGGEACRACRAVIEKTTIAGRTSCYCGTCQPMRGTAESPALARRGKRVK